MKIIRLFPRQVNVEINLDLEVEVSKEEIKVVLSAFKKAKNIPSPEGWMVELYLGFHYLIINDLQRTIEESRIFGRVLGPLTLPL
jgi:hypothetical protein